MGKFTTLLTKKRKVMTRKLGKTTPIRNKLITLISLPRPTCWHGGHSTEPRPPGDSADDHAERRGDAPARPLLVGRLPLGETPSLRDRSKGCVSSSMLVQNSLYNYRPIHIYTLCMHTQTHTYSHAYVNVHVYIRIRT